MAVAGLLCLLPASSQAAAPGYGSLVIGGNPATAGEWPSIAALISSSQASALNGQFCGGTLVSPRWVLTAAHCVVDDNGSVTPAGAIDVAVGAVKLSEVTAGQRIPVSEVVPNPGYAPKSSYGNDVAMLKLSRDSSQPVMAIIPPSDDGLVTAGRTAKVAGWGCAAFPVGSPPDCPAGGYPDGLQQAAITIQSDLSCASAYGSAYAAGQMICAGVASPNACFGDSGGPLTILGSAGTPVLVGDVSFGDEHCAGASDRGVYGRLSAYRSWIYGVMGAETETPATVGAPSAGSLGRALRYGVRQRVTCSYDCSARMKLQVSSGTARRYRLRSVTVGSARASLGAGTKETLTARFTSTARSRLRRARSLTVYVETSAASVGYLTYEKRYSLRIRR